MNLARNETPSDERRQLIERAFDAAGIDGEATSTNLTALLTAEEDS